MQLAGVVVVVVDNNDVLLTGPVNRSTRGRQQIGGRPAAAVAAGSDKTAHNNDVWRTRSDRRTSRRVINQPRGRARPAGLAGGHWVACVHPSVRPFVLSSLLPLPPRPRPRRASPRVLTPPRSVGGCCCWRRMHRFSADARTHGRTSGRSVGRAGGRVLYGPATSCIRTTSDGASCLDVTSTFNAHC